MSSSRGINVHLEALAGEIVERDVLQALLMVEVTPHVELGDYDVTRVTKHDGSPGRRRGHTTSRNRRSLDHSQAKKATNANKAISSSYSSSAWRGVFGASPYECETIFGGNKV